MTTVPSSETSERPLTRDILYAIRYYLGGRRALLILATVLIVGGIATNWSWLVAVGVAPIIVALLPCAVMCALGLCMHKMGSSAHTAHESNVGAETGDRSDVTARFIDPVSRQEVPAGTQIASVHLGTIYYFENRANRETFEADPDAYRAAWPTERQPDPSDKKMKASRHDHGCCG